MKFIAALVLFPMVLGVAAPNHPTAKTPLELWRVGDDGLTLRLADAIELEVKNSREFVVSTGRQPHSLLLTIPTNVDWKQIGNRTQVIYQVEFSTATRQQIGTSTGVCWENELRRCAMKIVRDAELAVSKTK